jgi:hypothetical protein
VSTVPRVIIVETHEPAPGVRPLDEIAADIARTWRPVFFGAVPYLTAMSRMQSISDNYGAERARDIVAYFLSNATTWRGPDARRIKAELKGMLAAAAKKRGQR